MSSWATTRLSSMVPPAQLHRPARVRPAATADGSLRFSGRDLFTAAPLPTLADDDGVRQRDQ